MKGKGKEPESSASDPSMDVANPPQASASPITTPSAVLHNKKANDDPEDWDVDEVIGWLTKKKPRLGQAIYEKFTGTFS
jgi:hypothetical protein